MTARVVVGEPAWGCTGCMRTFNRHGQQMPTGCNACPHWGGACTFVPVPAVYKEDLPTSLLRYTCGPLDCTLVPEAIKGLVEQDVVEALRRAWLTSAYGAGMVQLQPDTDKLVEQDVVGAMRRRAWLNKGNSHG